MFARSSNIDVRLGVSEFLKGPAKTSELSVGRIGDPSVFDGYVLNDVEVRAANKLSPNMSATLCRSNS